MKKNSYILLALLVLVFIGNPGFAENNMSSNPVAEINRVRLEERLENRLKSRLTDLLQDKGIFVIVKIRLSGEEITLTEGADGGDEYALPGVPVEMSMTENKSEEKRPVSTKKITSKISNIFAWIFVSKEISKEGIDKAKLLSTEILGINLDRGDQLTIETYFKERSFWSTLLSSDELLKVVILGFFMTAAVVFLFGPLGMFLRKLGKNFSQIRIQQLGGGTGGGQGGPLGEGHQSVGSQASTKAEKDKQEIEGFGFIDEENLEDLNTILIDSPVQDVIVVMNYIPGFLAVKVFNAMPSQKQHEVIDEQKQVKFMSGELVEEVREKIKDKIDNIYGGPSKISNLIQGCNQEIRESLLSWLKSSDPSFAQRVEDGLFEFKDISGYEPQSFRRIFRAVGLQSFAQAIKVFDEDMISEFASKLNPDIALLLKEQIKILPRSSKKAEEEQLKVLNAVSRLIKDGEIEQIKIDKAE